MWAQDAREMIRAGIRVVRIGEFAWSRLEPEPGQFDWAWLDTAIKTLADAGLKLVLCTPTATPPRWMLDRWPDMLARDENGHVRRFGSRRHYCFSHEGYRGECARIAGELARRYGRHPAIIAFQIDNEYGCHDTTLSWSDAARDGFRQWLAGKYGTIAALNRRWGNVFWSMEYQAFDQIELPHLTVTQLNPAHVLDFNRFSSDQVIAFNRLQCDALRPHTDCPLLHNYMGRITSFDHFALGRDLDIATWDSYPLGFLDDRSGRPQDFRDRFLRQGDPDFQAFHHDLYRSVGRGRMWVMEQQPGPVNWAPHNPAPAPGMVRLWTLEAIAHGAEIVSYFRWRQLPFGQEQMHAGLKRPDNSPASVLAEIASLADELRDLPRDDAPDARIALVLDYPSAWGWQALPNRTGATPENATDGFDYFSLVYDFYCALRQMGQTIDIISPECTDLSAYCCVIAPALMHVPESFAHALAGVRGPVLVGPRAAFRTADMRIPDGLPPSVPWLDCRITHVESLPANTPVPLEGAGSFQYWFEHVHTRMPVQVRTREGAVALTGHNDRYYLAGWPDAPALRGILTRLLSPLPLTIENMPEGLRSLDTHHFRYLFNYAATQQTWNGRTFPPASVTRMPRHPARSSSRSGQGDTHS